MIQYGNDCKDCESQCIGFACPIKLLPQWFCDRCGKRTDPRMLYRVDNEEYCRKCVITKLETVM